MFSGYLLFTNFAFDAAKNNLDCYRSRDYMENLCNDLREHPIRIVKYEKKKETILLTDEEKKSLEKQKIASYVKKISTNNYNDDNNYQKVKNHCNYTGKLRGAAHKYLPFKMQNTKKNSDSIS